jgi:cyclic nucleotide-binding protein
MQSIPLDVTAIVTIGMGVLGALFYVASLSMKTVIPLRMAAIASACFFLVYGFLAYSITTIFLYVILVPLNSYRLYELIQLIKKVRVAAGQDLSMDWLEPFMTKRKCRAGDLLFRKNDLADEMFLPVKGTFRIPELDKTIRSGEIFGELGLLTSEQRRTQSVECIEAGHVLTITYDKVRELYFENPEFGFYLLRLTSDRLLQEVARLERALAAERQKAS